MSHDSEKLLSLANNLETLAVELNKPATGHWAPSYFNSIPAAIAFINELKARKSGKDFYPIQRLGGVLITRDNKKFYDSKGFDYSSAELDSIESGDTSSEDYKTLIPRLKDLKKQLKFQDLEKAYAEFNDAFELISTAKKDKKSLDPKAKVRNRGTVCVPAESAKDKKDHFPINDADQARNALARVHQYSSVPSWYSGSLKGLQALVSRKVHSKYPKIGKEKKSFEEIISLLKTAEIKYSPEYAEQMAQSSEDLDLAIKHVKSKLHNLLKEKEELNFRGGPASERTRLNRAISALGDEILSLKLQQEDFAKKVREIEEFQEASPMNKYDSPSDYYASGAADD